jgi:hypothetical protein
MTNAVNIAQLGSNNVTMRNRIINGAMTIDQRNAGASVNPQTSYTLDRWIGFASQSGKYSVQQNAGSVTPPVGFVNYLGVTSSSSYSLISTDFFNLCQPIEGYNMADLNWGSANAKTVTLSFWVRSSLTGNFGGSIRNNAYDRTYLFSYTISSANTWEQKSITVTGCTDGTWLTTNGQGIQLVFSLGNGSNLQGGSAGSWLTSSDYLSPTGSTSVVGTNGATFYLTGVQLEEGTAASPFENRLYGTELALCQRYYQQNKAALVIANQTTSISGMIPLLVQLRAEPTLSKTSGTFKFGDMVGYAGTSTNTPIIATQINNNLQVSFSLEGFSGMTVYRTFKHEVEPSFTALFTMSAEL